MSSIKRLREVDLINLYCNKQSGYIFHEVSVGDKSIFGVNSTDRKIDIVIIQVKNKRAEFNYKEEKELFYNLIKEGQHEIEIIEAKTKLNRIVIGQILVGEFMFKKKFNVKKVRKSILYNKGDDAMELFCKKNQINLIKVKK